MEKNPYDTLRRLDALEEQVSALSQYTTILEKQNKALKEETENQFFLMHSKIKKLKFKVRRG